MSKRVAIVTGGSSGIGAAVVDRLRGQNVVVHVLDRRSSPPAYTVDVADEGACFQVVNEIGPVDILVNSAGIPGVTAPCWELPSGEFEQVVQVNLVGTYNMCRAVLPAMLKAGWGRIVTIASVAGKEGNRNAVPYSASKAGVIGLTKALAKEVPTRGILVNCVTPAVIDTPLLGQVAPEHLQYMVEKIPMNRLGRADEVAALVVWLC